VQPWFSDSRYLILLSVPDESSLLAYARQAEALGIPSSLVREPDLDDEATALALGPCEASQRLCSSLPLALREREVVAA